MPDFQMGRWYEDFVVGEVIKHRPGRTILESDNTWFTLLTNNTHPIHFDAHYASKTQFGKPLVNSALTLAVVAGMTVTDTLLPLGGEPGVDLHQDARPRLRGRYALLGIGDSRQARVEEQAGPRDRHHQDARLQPARRVGDGIRAKIHGRQEGYGRHTRLRQHRVGRGIGRGDHLSFCWSI